MFTGIVEAVGRVDAVTVDDDGRRLRIEADLPDLSPGQSISVAGVCLTVEAVDDGWFEVFTAAETTAKTTLAALDAGDPVNLERAVRVDDRLDGHIVQGHVDTTTTVEAVESVEEEWVYTFALPADHEQYVVARGSIALDGVSLTVAAVDEDAGTFRVAIIPETYHRTTFDGLGPGDRVNVEVDVIAKYVEGLVST
ncbi:MAG: riboflavin synthase [Halobacteriaceae archaeon]